MNRHLLWKRRLGILSRAFPASPRRRVILMYHAVGSGPWSLAEARFQEQMGWLAEHAQVVPLDRLLEDETRPGLQVALTFDDGYESVHKTAAPILARAGFAAAVYLNTACVGESRRVDSDEDKGHYPGERFLLWDEARALARAGWTIGSHGAEHVDLTRLPEADVERQLRSSKAAVEERLGAPCGHFAYTWGNQNAGVRAAAERCGYRWAAGAVHGPVSAASDRYALPRIDIRRDYALSDFACAVGGDWDYLGLVQSARRLLA